MQYDDPDLSRRGFLRGRMLTKEGREDQNKTLLPLGLSPPGLGADLIKEKCFDCTQPCVPVCSQKIIKVHADKHMLSFTPYLDFSRNGCTYCGACAEACPEIEAVDVSGLQGIGVAVLDQGRCFTWNGVFCMACLGRCNEKVLKLDARRQLELLSEACTGCGFCLRSCPANALSIQSVQ